MNIVPLVQPRKPASDLSQRLRELADLVDSGDVTDVILARVQGGSYEFLYAASLVDALVMSTLLQSNCVNRMRA